MKQLIRRLSRVADSSSSPQYSLLSRGGEQGRSRSFRAVSPFRARRSAAAVPQGHLPVYVGDEMARYVVSAELLNHPIFVRLLNKSAQEYGYEQKGALRIPCHVVVFERVLEALHLGADPVHLLDLVDQCECFNN